MRPRSRSLARRPCGTHERMIMLSVLDGLWKDHLLNMDHLKEGIGLRGYGQKDPLVEYKKESFDMFEGMMARFQEDTVRYLFLMQIIGPDGKPVAIPSQRRGPVPAAPPVASAASMATWARTVIMALYRYCKKRGAGDDDRFDRTGVPAQEAAGAGTRAHGGRWAKRAARWRSGAPAIRLDGTILALADRARNIRNAMGRGEEN